MADNAFGPKPIMDVNLITPFGGIEDLESFKQEGIAQRSYTYVPGFSEMLENYDSDVRQVHLREKSAKDVRILPVNLRWFRTVKGTGSDPDQMRVAHAKNLGYRAATKDDVGQAWLTEVPPGANVGPDGTIKSAAGDLVLMVANQQTAARNAVRRKMAAEAAVDGMQLEAEGLRKTGEKLKADPTISVQIGDKSK